MLPCRTRFPERRHIYQNYFWTDGISSPSFLLSGNYHKKPFSDLCTIPVGSETMAEKYTIFRKNIRFSGKQIDIPVINMVQWSYM